MNIDDCKSKVFCVICHVGSPQPCQAMYARWHSGQFVLRPGMPAWRCDFCGDTFYDDDALGRLALLLGPETDSGDQQQWRTTGLEETWNSKVDGRRLI